MYTPKGEINDKLLEAMKDAAFMEKFSAAETPEAAFALVKEVEPEMTMDELKASANAMLAFAQEQESGILSEEDLDQVAGGSKSGAKQFFEDFGAGFKVGWTGTLKVMKAIVGAD